MSDERMITGKISNIDDFRTALSLRNDLGCCCAFDNALVKAIQYGEQVNWHDVLELMATEYAEHAKNSTYDKFWMKVDKICR